MRSTSVASLATIACAVLATSTSAQVLSSSTAIHTCALLTTQKLKCWGSNTRGQLGLETTSASLGGAVNSTGDFWPETATNGAPRSFCAGSSNTCAVRESDGSVFCWGHTEYGMLGREEEVEFTDEDYTYGDEPGEMGAGLQPVKLGTDLQATAVYCGGDTACAVTTNGTAKCWGATFMGAIGSTSTATSIGNGPDDMGDNLPFLDLGEGAKVVKLAMGISHSCALLEGGLVKCFGTGTEGQLCQGNEDDIGSVPGSMGDNLAPINFGGQTTGAIDVAVGLDHTCIVRGDGKVYCCGNNLSGQLGQEDTARRGNQPSNAGDNLPVVDLGVGVLVQKIAAGVTFTCALTQDGRVKCWGSHLQGRLGLGVTAPVGNKDGDMGDALPFVDFGAPATAIDLTMGARHVCVTRADYTVVCWGQGTEGKLGSESTANVGLNILTMGTALVPVNFGGIPKSFPLPGPPTASPTASPTITSDVATSAPTLPLASGNTSAPTTGPPEDGRISIGVIVGIIVGSILFCCLWWLLIFLLCCRRRRAEKEEKKDELANAGGEQV